ncbi:MAG: ABC transporter substrate-binding protein [Verrucomicrobiota bacterium]
MKKIAFGFVFIVVVAILSYSIIQRQTTPKSPTLTKVVISEAFEVFLHAPLWIAYEKGFFKEEGLDVTINIAGGDEKSWAAVLNNDAQFAVGDPVFVAISGEKDQPGVVVASILNGMPFWGVAKNESVPEIKKPEDLGSYSVATLPAPSTNYALQRKMFESAGIKPNIKEVAFGGLLPALYAGEVDIALEFEPNVSTAVENGNRIVYSLADYYPDFAFTGLIALPDYVAQHKDTVQKVVNALQKANAYIRTDTVSAAAILAKKFNVSQSIAENGLKNLIGKNAIQADTITGKNAWIQAVNVRVELSDLQKDAPYENYVITSFSERAKSAY